MGTYSTIAAQKLVDGKWVTLDPIKLGCDPDIPYHYGKLDMMRDLDSSAGLKTSIRQDFMSPEPHAEPWEFAPWAGRGFPEDIGDLDVEIFFDAYTGSLSWATLDEILEFDYENKMIIDHTGKRLTWAEHLGPGFRLWFEKLRDYGAERIIYCLC